MATEHVLEVPVRRHIIDSGQPFASVLDGIFGGISQPDIGPLFSDLEASTSYEQFSSLVRQAQGSAGLMRFWQLDLDVALTLDPQARQQAGRRLVRLIAGNPGHHGADDPPCGRCRLVRAGHHPHPGVAGWRNPCRLRLGRLRAGDPSGEGIDRPEAVDPACTARPCLRDQWRLAGVVGLDPCRCMIALGDGEASVLVVLRTRFGAESTARTRPPGGNVLPRANPASRTSKPRGIRRPGHRPVTGPPPPGRTPRYSDPRHPRAKRPLPSPPGRPPFPRKWPIQVNGRAKPGRP